MGDFTEDIQIQLQDTYEVIGQIGEGGGGAIYKAYHKRLQKEVVIKKMHMKSGNELKNRQEADILKNLRHSYLPQVLDFIEAGKDVYTVIDFIPGESFQQLLDRNVKFSQDKILKYARQLCEALMYLHGQKIPILHGDIKPANIMLTPTDDVCLIDFNISGFFEQNEIMAIGYSKGYAAPEQKALVMHIQKRMLQPETLKGFKNKKECGIETVLLEDCTELLTDLDKDNVTETLLLDMENETEFLDTSINSIFVENMEHKIDVRSDIYSLGATLYHLLSGQRPDDEQVQLVYEQLSEISSEALAYIITTAMQTQKEERFQSAEKMLEALNQIAKLDKRYKKLLWRQRMELLSSFTICLIGIVLIFIGLRMNRMEQDYLYEEYLLQMEEAGNNTDFFEANFKKCIALNESDPRAYYEKAVWLYKNRDYEACLDYVHQLFRKFQFEDMVIVANLYLLSGNCYYEEGDCQNAVKELETALGYDGQNRAIYRDLAIAYAGAGRCNDAQAVLDQAIENGLEEDQIYLVQGEIAGSQGEIATAQEKFRKCLDITNDDAIRTRAYVFYCDLDKNSTESLLDSVQMLERGIRELPLGNSIILYERLAQMYINLETNTNDLQYSRKAIQVFNDMIDAGAASYQVYMNLTILYEQIGDFEKAHETVDRAIDLYGNNYVSYKRRAFLEADEQSYMDIDERDYHEFERNYIKAVELYKETGEEDSEMLLLEKIYRELVQADWL